MRAASPAMSWFRITDGCLRFGGRVNKGPVREWLATADGSSAANVAGLLDAISAPAVRQIRQ